MQFPAMFAVIEHPERGPVLFDTGYGQPYLDARRKMLGKLYNAVAPVTTNPELFAAARCRSAGIDPADVSLVVASHFHADHIAGLVDFPNARIRFFRRAWEAVAKFRGLRALRRGFLPSLIPNDFAARADPIEDAVWTALAPEFTPFARGVDLFGDGSLTAVLLPGHAAGQLGLFVQRVSAPPMFLVADACWTRRSLEEEIVPSAVTRILFDDMGAYRATLGRIASFARSRPDVEIVPSHCAEIWRRRGNR